MRKLWNNKKTLEHIAYSLVIAWLVYLALIMTIPWFDKPGHVIALFSLLPVIWIIVVAITIRKSDLSSTNHYPKPPLPPYQEN